MTNRQENLIRSFVGLSGVLKDNKSVVEQYPALKRYSDLFSVKYDEMQKIAASEGINVTGYTQDKNQAKYDMAVITNEIAGAGLSYANTVGNQALKKVFGYAISTIATSSDQRAYDICKSVLDEATTIKAHLQDEDVTDEDLAELKDVIDKFEASRSQKGVVASQSKVNSQFLDKAVKDMSALLRQNMGQPGEQNQAERTRFCRPLPCRTR